MVSSIRYSLWLLYNCAVVALAALWRRLMGHVTVVAITGSVGKSTASKCLQTILSSRFEYVGTNSVDNGRYGLPRVLLKIRPRHRFAVLEVGIVKPGRMWRSARMIRPDIVVVTGIANRHMKNFASIKEVASEKGRLVRGLKKDGLAVVNRNDDRVVSLANGLRCRTAFFGSSCDTVWADEVSATWPNRLRLRVNASDGSHWLQTKLVGRHWVTSVIAAIATAKCCGVSVGESVEALQDIGPPLARLDPSPTPQGAIVLRDEFNGSVTTYLAALRILNETQIRRRIVVCGTVVDAASPPCDIPTLAAEMCASSERVLFVGPHNLEVSRAVISAGMPPDQVHRFTTAREAADFLLHEIRSGDLILLRGQAQDHLSRLYFALWGDVKCWKHDCRFVPLCDGCAELGFNPLHEGAPETMELFFPPH